MKIIITVEELIEKLHKFNPKAEVEIIEGDGLAVGYMDIGWSKQHGFEDLSPNT